MTEESTLGDLVRERRLAAGYSLGQLASKVGRTAAVVREWERGEGYPDPDLVERLAETLEIDLGDIAAMLPPPEAAVPPPPPEPEPPAPAAPAVAPPAAPAAVPAEATPATPAADDDVPQMDDDLDLGDLWSAADTAIEVGDPVEVGDPPPPIPVLDLADAPTEAIFPPVGAPFPEPAREPYAEAPAAVATMTAPRRPPSPWDAWFDPFRALFDPQKRWLYWIRAVLTIVVIIVLFLVLAWAVKELFAALSEVLHSIEPTDTGDNVLGLVTAVGGAG